MRKIYSLLILVLISFSVKSQADFTIGIGNTNSLGSGYPAPIQDFYEGSRAQYLYTASELLAAGIGPGIISAIKIDVSSLGTFTGDIQDFTIGIGSTATSSLDLTQWEIGTVPIFGPIDYVPTIGTNVFVFSTPFFWNGTDNLVVEICNGRDVDATVTTWTSNVICPMTSGLTFNGSHTYRADNAGSLCATSVVTNNGTATTRPDMTFTWTSPTICSGTPTAGVTVSSKDTICPSQKFILSTAGSTLGSGLTYQWDSSKNGINYFPITGATGFSLQISGGITSNTWYRRSVTCNSGGSTVFSTPTLVRVKSLYECYCGPLTNTILYTSSTTTSIESVAIVGGTLNYTNSHPGSNTAPTLGYAGFTDSTGTTNPAIPIVKQASTYTITLTTSTAPTANGAGYWVDWNHNGLFDSAEYVNVKFTTGTLSADVDLEVPENATLGLTLIRFRTSNGTISYASGCTQFGNGETEDYVFRVIAGDPCIGTPSVGTAVGSVTTICPNVAFTVSVTGGPIGVTNLSYQWQVSTNGGSSFTDIVGATSKTYRVASGITSATCYRRKTICGNGGASATSASVCITMSPIIDCYCSPLTGVQLHASAGSPSINGIDINGVSLTNSTVGVAPSLGYTLYGDSTNFTLSQAVSYTLSITASAKPTQAYVWFDWDRSGSFEASEATEITTFPTGSPSVATVNVDVPLGASLGATLMRIRMRAANITNNACQTGYGSGESEDYAFTIVPGAPCTGTPVGGTAASANASVCAFNPFEVTVTGATDGLTHLTYRWEYSINNGTTWDTVTNGIGKKLSVSGISVPTCYRRKIICNGTASSYSTVVCLAINSFYECYCNYNTGTTLHSGTPTYFINQVDIAGGTVNFSNPTNGFDPTPSLGYSAFIDTNAMFTVKQGTTYTATLTTSLTPPTNGAKYWVDWNHNNKFDSAEVVNIAFTAGNTVSIASFDVPANAPLGLTMLRFRIANVAITGLNACATFFNGETEDYIFRVIPGTPCVGAPTGGVATSSVVSICPNIPFSLDVTGSTEGVTGLKYRWEYSINGGTTWDTVANGINKTLSVNGITTATCYRRKINCGSSSSYSAPVCVTMNAIISCYCSPLTGTTLHSSTSPTIENVAIAGGVVTYANSSPGANAAPSLGYSLFDDTLSTFTLAQTYTYVLTVTASGTPSQAAVWIDWDRSGSFEASEYNVLTFTGTTGNLNIPVPANAQIGATLMRIRIRAATFTTNACEQYGSGETEDYAFRVIAPPICTGKPVGGITNANATLVCNNTPISLDVTGASEGLLNLSYQWQDSTLAGNWQNVVGQTSLTYSTTQSVAKYYRRKIKCASSNDSSYSVPVFVSQAPLTYATLPFSESFEAVWLDGCGTLGSRNIPNNSWRSSPMTTDSSWRRSDDGTTANWTNPANGVYVPSASVGAYSARFHSANTINKSGSLEVYLNCSGGVAAKRLSFDYINTSGTDSMQVYLSTDAGLTFNKIGAVRNATSWTNTTIDFSASSATTVIKFKVNGDFSQSDFGLDNVSAIVLYPTDLATTALVSPATNISFTSTGNITVTIKNTGTNAINFATNSASFGGYFIKPSSSVHTAFGPFILNTGTLAVGATQNVTITTTADFSALGAYQIKAGFSGLAIDGNTINDSTGLISFNATGLVVRAVANGNWGDGSTWNTGTVPTAGDTVNITGFAVNLGGAAASPYTSGSIGIGLGGILNAGTNVLNVGTTGGGNKIITVAKGGTISITGGTINHNGFVAINDSANFIMSAGNLKIDGNDGTDASSVPAGTSLLSIGGATNYASGNIDLTGGTLTFVDPHRFGGVTFGYKGLVSKNIGAGHTTVFGDPTSTHTANSGNFGFSINILQGGAKMSLGSVVVNGGNTVGNRFTTIAGSTGFNGDFTINANSDARFVFAPYFAGNFTNNGLYACSNATNFQNYTNATASAATNSQTISGSGVYRNTTPILNVTAAGTGYAVGNILTLTGGTSTSPLTIYVSAVNGTGGITSAVSINTGAYTVVPTGANAATGGAGSGATFTTPVGGMTTVASFSGLTFNNTSAAGVTISSFGTALPSQTATINGGGGVLTLIAGAVNNASNTIVVGNSVTQKGSIVATAGYVTGKIKRWFSAATNTTTTGDLPVGKNGAPRYARVEFTTAPTKGGTLTAEYIATAPGLAGFPINDGISLANIQNTGFWRIDTDSIVGGNYTISLTDTIPTGVQSLSTLRSVKRATGTSTWSVDGTAGTNTGIATKPTVVRTGVTGFSEFAIAGASDNLLPVASLKFTGSRVGNTNQLKWTVTNEVAVKGYDLQRSVDGNNFNTIANVLSKADGNNNKLDYSYNDNNSITADGYYRLKQIAKDGSTTYSNIVLIKGSRIVGVVVGNIYPNPVKDMLNMVVASSSNKSVTAIVTSINGKQVVKTTRTLNNGDTNLQLNLSKIAAGTYTIVLLDANGNKSNVVSFVKD